MSGEPTRAAPGGATRLASKRNPRRPAGFTLPGMPALLLALALLLLLPAGAAAAPDQVMTFEAPRELLNPAEQDATLDEIRGLGVTRVRALVYWRDYAPRPRSRRRPDFEARDPAAYGAAFARLDRLLDAADARGIAVQLTLTGPVPRWATRGRRDQLTEPDARAFGAFAEAVGRRYRDRVAIWSIWNEPNQPQFLLPQYRDGRPASPRIYRRLYLAGHQGLVRSGNGRDTILLGETSPIGNARRVVEPLDFLRGTLCLDERYRKRRGCARLPAGGYAHHPYTKRAGPTFVPPDADDVTIGVLTRLTRALDRAARAGAIPRGLELYLTEFGIQSTPDRLAGVSLAQQAEYLAISERIAYFNSRVAAMSQYLLRDDRPREGSRAERYSGFESGLRRWDGRPKPSYDGFRLPLVAIDYGRHDVLWGRVRPATGQTIVTVQARRREGRWRTVGRVTTNRSAVWGARVAHRDGQRYRVRWTAPDGRTYTGPAIRPY